MRQAALTSRKVLQYATKILLVSHAEAGVSFEGIAPIVQSILDRAGKVKFVPTLEALRETLTTWAYYDVLLVENLTMLVPGEQADGSETERLRTARCFSPFVDFYVWECFSQSHLLTTSLTLLPTLVREACVGSAFQAEMKAFASIAAGTSARHSVGILGGDALRSRELLGVLCFHCAMFSWYARSTKMVTDPLLGASRPL